jgi:hypothetical protein
MRINSAPGVRSYVLKGVQGVEVGRYVIRGTRRSNRVE